MALDLDPVVIMNLVLAVAILILGVWVYERKNERLALYVSIGFGLFAASHALTLLGYGDLQAVILPLRALGYLVIIVGLGLRLIQAEKSSAVSRREEPGRVPAQPIQ